MGGFKKYTAIYRFSVAVIVSYTGSKNFYTTGFATVTGLHDVI